MKGRVDIPINRDTAEIGEMRDEKDRLPRRLRDVS